METKFTQTTVSDLISMGVLEKPLDGNHGGTHPKSSDYVASGIPFIMASDLLNGRIDTIGCKFITLEQARKLRKGFAKEGDVLLSHKATIGRTAIVGAIDTEYVMLTPQVTYYRVKDPNRLNNRYLKYYFDSEGFQNLLNQWAGGGSTRAYLGITGQLRLPVVLPDITSQESIAHFVGTLDDKIELNRQINTTLEAMAQALFKSWFVDFDPVIDNALAAGNPIPDELTARAERRKQLHARKSASSSEHLTLSQPVPAALQQPFPDRFVFTETMGWVPEGWEVSTIGEHVENTGGGTPSTKNEAFWQGGSHAFCTPKDMSRLTSWMLTDTERHLTDAGVKKVSSGLLPKRTVLMSSRAPIGYLAISNIPVSVNQGVIAMLPNALFGPLYLLSWAKFNMGNIIDRANGSTFLEISKKNFRPIPFLVPNSSACQAFNKEAEAILEKILLLSEQNISLTNLRDTLLPKLLSGQLRIPEAEQHIAEVI